MPLGSDEALALAGMMGSGKSTAAAELSRPLGRRVVSTDAEVVRRAGKPEAAVFGEHGEAASRALERAVVASLTGPLVIDLGGGGFRDPAGAVRLMATERVGFLDVRPEVAARRIAAEPGAGARPLLGRWSGLLARRLPLNRRAHQTVEVGALSPQAVARQIVELVTRREPEQLLEGP